MATQKKIDTVAALTEKLAKAKAIIFADYVGIKHKQLEELRKNLKKAGGEFTVTKNKLFERALGDRAASVKAHLANSTGTVFAYADEVAPLKELLKFFKAVGFGKPKGALLGSSVLSGSDVVRLSQLPGRDVLLGQLARQLNAPIQGLHYALSWNLNRFAWALNAIKEKKG